MTARKRTVPVFAALVGGTMLLAAPALAQQGWQGDRGSSRDWVQSQDPMDAYDRYLQRLQRDRESRGMGDQRFGSGDQRFGGMGDQRSGGMGDQRFGSGDQRFGGMGDQRSGGMGGQRFGGGDQHFGGMGDQRSGSMGGQRFGSGDQRFGGGGQDRRAMAERYAREQFERGYRAGREEERRRRSGQFSGGQDRSGASGSSGGSGMDADYYWVVPDILPDTQRYRGMQDFALIPDYSRPMDRLLVAAQSLREAIQSTAIRLPPSDGRDRALDMLNEALIETQQAMVALPPEQRTR
ncbi:hypothetical protein [Falsiroseomonas sp.]|uniref:hypothetical protein n=1 Tax=Falsiroseomonas sp. TaxID=2870721 RepID=UPI00356199ED